MDTDSLKFCFIDTETTGLSNNSNIIELAWVITDKNLNVIKEESHIINGDFEITDFIQNLTGISKEKTVNEGISIQSALLKFYNDILKCQFLVAHNIYFDYKMIINEINNIFKENNNELTHYTNVFQSKIRLCSQFILKKECFEREIDLENNKLQTFYNRLIEEPMVQTHRALNDIYMIIECFQELYEFDILRYFWNKHISFGKHKKKTNEWIYDNDREYFNWLLTEVYNVDTLNKKYELLYYDEEYEYDGFVVPDVGNYDNIENTQTENEIPENPTNNYVEILLNNDNNDYVEINDGSDDETYTETESDTETDISSSSDDSESEDDGVILNITDTTSNKRRRTE